MKKSKITAEHITFALRQAESGLGVEETCRKLGVSQETSSDCPPGHPSAGGFDGPWLRSSVPMRRRIDSRSGRSPRPMTTVAGFHLRRSAER